MSNQVIVIEPIVEVDRAREHNGILSVTGGNKSMTQRRLNNSDGLPKLLWSWSRLVAMLRSERRCISVRVGIIATMRHGD